MSDARSSRRTRRVSCLLTSVLLLLAAVFAVALPPRVADAEKVELASGAKRNVIEGQALGVWDHPFQRLGIRAVAIVEARVGEPCASEMGTDGPWRVRLYTFFGLPFNEVVVTCEF